MGKFLPRLILVAALVFMGAAFFVLGIKDHRLGKESVSWPSVQGTLTSESLSNRKKRAKIFYQYEVNKVIYKNYRVNFQDDRASKKRIRDRYNPGDKLTVFYNPDDPEQSVLEPGATMTTLLIKIFGGIFCFLLAGVFLMMRRR